MKFALKCTIVVVCLLLCGAAFAQTSHSATLAWTASTDATASSTYNIYRGTGACTATPTMSNIGNTALVAYTDSTITAGTWCYYVKALLNGVEAIPSNTAGGTASPNPATGLTVVVK
jgi:hypothetical protein